MVNEKTTIAIGRQPGVYLKYSNIIRENQSAGGEEKLKNVNILKNNFTKITKSYLI